MSVHGKWLARVNESFDANCYYDADIAEKRHA